MLHRISHVLGILWGTQFEFSKIKESQSVTACSPRTLMILCNILELHNLELEHPPDVGYETTSQAGPSLCHKFLGVFHLRL